MKTNAFDELIREKFDEGEFAYNPDNWNKLAAQLPDKKPWNRSAVIFFLLSAVAACFAMTFAIKAWLSRTELNMQDNQVRMATVHQHKTQQVAAPVSTQPAITIKQIAQHRLIAFNRQPKTSAAKNVALNTVTETTKPDLKYTTASFSKPAAHAEHQSKELLTHAPTADRYIYDNSETVVAEKVKEKRKLSLSLAGGLNYGATNNGFALGAVAQKRISKKVYLEGNIAYVSNSITQEQQQVKYAAAPDNNFSPSSTGTAASVAAPNTITNVSNTRYVQVTPAVGYNLLKHLSVGVGADFQQLLNNNGQPTYIASGESAKELPSMDMGIVGKTEYMVSKRLSAGVLYREGVNNALSGGGNKYFDRSYLQVQVKINVLGK